MAIVPTKYVFIKESNGNVTLETYDGSTLLGTASLNPAKDIRISESYPNSIIIPFNTTGNHIDNKFVSIPWQRIDFVGSTPSNTAPADINEAVAILGEDFFFELGGSGGSLARNGLDVVSGFVELGGDLIRDTTIDTDGNDFSILSGDMAFIMGQKEVAPSFNVPFWGLFYSDTMNATISLLEFVGNPPQIQVGWLDFPNQAFNGLASRKVNQQLSQYTPDGVYQHGISAYDGSQFSDNGNCDHYTFDRANNIDVSLVRVDEKHVFISHCYDPAGTQDVNKIEVFNGGINIDSLKLLLPKVTPLNFADDTAAAEGGVDLNQVYHNNGELRIRIV